MQLLYFFIIHVPTYGFHTQIYLSKSICDAGTHSNAFPWI